MMVSRDYPSLSVSRQCRLLEMSRSTVHHRPAAHSAQTLALMRRIDKLYLRYPFYGSRQMVRHLAREEVAVGRHRVRRLMRLLGLQAIYCKPRTTVANPDHPSLIFVQPVTGFQVTSVHSIAERDAATCSPQYVLQCA